MLSIHFVNDSSEKELPEVIGHYNYVVLVNGERIDEGRLENFNRLTGWKGLVKYLTGTLEEDNE